MSLSFRLCSLTALTIWVTILKKATAMTAAMRTVMKKNWTWIALFHFILGIVQILKKLPMDAADLEWGMKGIYKGNKAGYS